MDGEIEVRPELMNENLSEEISTVVLPYNAIRVKKGVQTVTAPLPKEALEQSGRNVVAGSHCQVGVERRSGCWRHLLGSQHGGMERSGFFRLALKPVNPPDR